MFYNGQPSPINNWTSNVQYPSYQPDRVTNKKVLGVFFLFALYKLQVSFERIKNEKLKFQFFF